MKKNRGTTEHLLFHVQIEYPSVPCSIASKINVTPKGVNLPIITKVKFVTAVKFHYRVLQLTAVFLTTLRVPLISLAIIQLVISSNLEKNRLVF